MNSRKYSRVIGGWADVHVRGGRGGCGAGGESTAGAAGWAEGGIRVLLLDKARFPRPKACGVPCRPGRFSPCRRRELKGCFSGHRILPERSSPVAPTRALRKIVAGPAPGVPRFAARSSTAGWSNRPAAAGSRGAGMGPGSRAAERDGERIALRVAGERMLARGGHRLAMGPAAAWRNALCPQWGALRP